jgi:carbamoyl-phosphate synthase large subunit
MSKVMVLGASQCQVPIIRQAQDMGFEVIVVSIGGNYPGFSVADKAYEIDVRDREQILQVARKEGISGILTDQTDIPVLTVAYVADKMGLPGIGYDCALRFTNKYEMRQYCQRIGIPVPKHVQVGSCREALSVAADLQFPLVIKPVDSQGSRGVAKVPGMAELEAAFGKAINFSAVHQAILEEFCTGKEIVIEGFMGSNDFVNLVIGDREYFNMSDMFIPSRTIFPSNVHPELQEELFDLNSRLIKGFNPKFGITHSEFLVDESTGEIKLVETAVRGGGVFISSDLIPLASGVDANRLLIEYATGTGNASIDVDQIRHHASAYLCFFLPEGHIRSIRGVSEARSIKGVHKVFLDNLQVGDTVGPMTDKTMRKGPILISAENRPQLDEIIAEVQNTLKIEVQTSSGVGSMVW